MKNTKNSINVLIAEAGDESHTLDAYSDASQQIREIVARKYPEASLDLLSDYLRAMPSDREISKYIAELLDNVGCYDLLIVYIPEPHMLNAVLVRIAYERDIPIIAVLQCDDEGVVSAMASYVASNIPDLVGVLESVVL